MITMSLDFIRLVQQKLHQEEEGKIKQVQLMHFQSLEIVLLVIKNNTFCSSFFPHFGLTNTREKRRVKMKDITLNLYNGRCRPCALIGPDK